MSGMAGRLLRDEVTVETKTGDSAFEAVHAAPVTVMGKVSRSQTLVRDAGGAELLSQLTVYVSPDDAALFTADSVVTVGSYSGRVISASVHSRPGQDVIAKVVCT